MAEDQLQQFLEKVRQLNAFVALSEADPAFRQRLSDCANHQQVVDLASSWGFDIARRWGEPPSQGNQPMVSIGGGGADLQDRGLALLVDGDNGSAQNLLSGPCPAPGQERSDRLLGPGQLRLELIHSCEFANPPGFWYDQSESEWVLLLQGGALLRFADEAQARSLKAGDSLLITPGRRHRVEATDPAPGTRWLALFW
jgi:cupin 2 domain-containing protein